MNHVQLEEMITPKLLNTVKKMKAKNHALVFCMYCIRKYGYPEYSITPKFLQRNGEKLLSLLKQLDELLLNSTMTIEDRAP